MVYSVVVVLVGLFSTLAAEPSHDHYHDVQIPQMTSDLLEDIARHMPCPGENCPYNLRVAADVHAGYKKPVSSCLRFCDEFFEKEFLLEDKHPQLTALRINLLSYLKEVSYTYVQNPEKPKDLIIEVLNEFIHLMRRLKEVFETGCSRELPEEPVVPVEEIVAEEEISPGFVGSVRGIPGIHFPNYTEVPITSFSCGDVQYIPGFYADLETRCQVFHVCYEHRRESFLCPVGTTFNQPILACDYWYSSNCSLSTHYYDVNAKKEEPEPFPEDQKEDIEEIITTIIEQDKAALPKIHVKTKDTGIVKSELEQVFQFLPVKAKVLEFSVQADVKPSHVIPEVKPAIDPKLIVAPAIPVIKFAVSKAKAIPALKAKVIAPVLKAKVAAAAIPVVKSKIAAAIAVDALKAKAAIPVKAKIVASIPAVKSKIVKDKIAVAAALPVKAKIAAAAALPVKAKIAAAVPVKAKIATSAALPLLKAKTVAKVLPVVKAAAISAPIVKTKAAMISPLTKKALALGYMKLLKAKKLALMG